MKLSRGADEKTARGHCAAHVLRIGWPGAMAACLLLTVAACSAAAPGSAQASRGASPAGGSGLPSPAPAETSPAAAVAANPGCRGAETIPVATAAELRRALADARPGQTIVLRPGIYQGNFTATTSGTPGAPISLCGSRSAVLDGGDVRHGYVVHLDRASWWRLSGFTVQNGQKGVVADGVTHDLVTGLLVHSIGDEGIHLREFSSDNVVSHCVVRQTGLRKAFFGEGIYVGSAHHNWCKYTGCRPDTSDRNVIAYNDIADTTAENIDIKEGTTGGTIVGNHLDGTGMATSAATAWVNVKGNHWTITGNFGTSSEGDGFQVHQVYPGWGLGNVFSHNHAAVHGPGYGIYVQNRRLGTVVSCSNVVTSAVAGFSNDACVAG